MEIMKKYITPSFRIVSVAGQVFAASERDITLPETIQEVNQNWN